MDALKAIETEYAGHRFRSRLEARYAVFFDELGWSWKYESEGFDLPYSGYYLPDFLVTPPKDVCDQSFWVEVKAQELSVPELNKLRELACLSGLYGYCFTSEKLREAAGYGPDENRTNAKLVFSFGDVDCQVPHSTFMPFIPIEERNASNYEEPSYNFMQELFFKFGAFRPKLYSPDMFRAARAALGARFEHGESGPARSLERVVYEAETASWDAYWEAIHTVARRVLKEGLTEEVSKFSVESARKFSGCPGGIPFFLSQVTDEVERIRLNRAKKEAERWKRKHAQQADEIKRLKTLLEEAA